MSVLLLAKLVTVGRIETAAGAGAPVDGALLIVATAGASTQPAPHHGQKLKALSAVSRQLRRAEHSRDENLSTWLFKRGEIPLDFSRSPR